MNNDPIKPTNMEPENLEVNAGENNVVNTNVSNEPNKNVHPTSASIKDIHGIDTSVFKKNTGPRIETDTETTVLHAEAFNAVNKEQKPVETLNEDKPEKSKTGLIVFMILLVLFVLFLPNIKSLVTVLMNGKENQNITDGELRCVLNKTTNNFDIKYEQNIPFENGKLISLQYIETTKGDMNKDKEELEKKNASCEMLGSLANNIAGFTVDCEFTGESVVEKQNIDYATIVLDTLNSAYAETGGNVPEFEYNADINDVQKRLQASGYTCKKIR